MCPVLDKVPLFLNLPFVILFACFLIFIVIRVARVSGAVVAAADGPSGGDPDDLDNGFLRLSSLNNDDLFGTSDCPSAGDPDGDGAATGVLADLLAAARS